LQVDRNRDQLLVHDLVEVALDRAAIGVGSDDKSLARRTQLRVLEAQPTDLFPQRLDVPSLQGDRPPTPCLPEVAVIGRRCRAIHHS
jgi:hypothetical protein